MFSSFGTYGSYHWWPYNVSLSANSAGGWRFVADDSVGEVLTTSGVYNWIDSSAILHAFDPSSGYSVDGSGYKINFGPVRVISPNGTEVFPQMIDRYGNYFSYDSSGNLVDDTGRTPVIKTVNGNVTYYDVLAPNGPINNNGTRVRYTVTTASVPVSTNFAQSDIYEWVSPDLLTPVQSIQLPDGSAYAFTYDNYGELASMTLPTGGVIQYGYSNFVDSSSTANRWLTSRTVGSNPAMTFAPAVVHSCSDYASGCVETVTMHKPSGDDTVYELTLNNGAWNSSVSIYTGSDSGRQLLAQTSNTFDFSTPCPSGVCTGSEYIAQSLETTSVPMIIAGVVGSIKSYQQPIYTNPATGQLTALKEWDYMSSAPPPGIAPSGTPSRETDYTYAGYDVQMVTVKDSSGTVAGQTIYGYTTTATPTSGVAQHGTTNSGGPYLHTVTHWLNTGTSPVVTYNADDTGQVLSIQDADGHSPMGISYQCANSLPYQVTNPLGQTGTYGSDCNSGAITSVQDPNDAAAGRAGTTYTYDTAGRISTATLADSGVTTYTYPSTVEIDTTVTASPNPSITTASILDSFGRPYQTIQNGVTSETTYDVNGRLQTITNPHTGSASSTDGSTSIWQYDGLNRPTLELTSGGTEWQFVYNGNATTAYDPNFNSRQRTTDAFGHLTSVSEFLSGSPLVSNYSYDGLGNITRMSQLGNGSSDVPRVRTFTYDSMARLVCASNPESSSARCPVVATSSYTAGTVGYSYDGNSNLLTKTAPAPSSTPGSGATVTTSFGYDQLNRLTSKSYSGDLEATPSSCYQYDSATNGIGRLAFSWTQPGGCSSSWSAASGNATSATNILEYDPVGRIRSEQQCVFGNCSSSGTPFTVGYGYDLAGNRTATNLGALPGVGALSFTTPSTNGYDSSGRLQQLLSSWVDSTHPAALFTIDPTSGYTPPGGLQKATFGSGLLLNRTYDSRLRVTGEVVQNP